MISWRDGEGKLHKGSLFAVFAALARGDAWSFPALRPHQREPWHAFTVQVAALALIQAGIDALPNSEASWRDLLIGLTPEQPDGEAWALVVDDWSKPALLQPPVITAAIRADHKGLLPTPDALDMLVTSKNHDVKQERIAEASEQEWLFALVTLQTASAYGGSKTYGASRMNGKTGSRLIARIKPRGGSAAAFRRDALLLAKFAQEEKNLRALLWLEPNDGKIPYAHYTLAPSLYVDCARRIRIFRSKSGYFARYATAENPRVNADAYAGKTGDPYAPIKPAMDGSVTPKRYTFGYEGISRLLSNPLPLLAKLADTDDKEALRISFSALVRKGGTDTNTEGLFARDIPISRIEEIEQYGPVVIFDKVGEVARRRSEEASAASGKLKYALLVLLQGAPSEPGASNRLQVRTGDASSDRRAKDWVSRFNYDVDRVFFDGAFWTEAVDTEMNINDRLIWRQRLQALARVVLAEAAEAAPRTEMRRIRAIARSGTMLETSMAKWLKEVAP
jgi:CRISPR system Cascade subunit CasA